MTGSPAARRGVWLRVLCAAPPPVVHEDAPAEFGIQDKQGSVQAGQRASDGAVVFDIPVDVLHTGGERPRFRGPFVHGPAGASFLYLSWRKTVAGSPWIRRMKVPLSGITWEQIEAAEASYVIVTSVGGLVTSTARLPEAGWTVEEK